ncbi:MAG TPA: hypothetical protein VL614_21365 [Acetobacteraceae bacterium]|nr:hypothetical protein [Acetobacteraceae bacterium]
MNPIDIEHAKLDYALITLSMAESRHTDYAESAILPVSLSTGPSGGSGGISAAFQYRELE